MHISPPTGSFNVIAAIANESRRFFRRHTGLLRFLACVHLDEQQRHCAALVRIPVSEPRRASAGPANGWHRTVPPPRAPCWSAGARSDAVRCPAYRSRSAGHFALASCTRFSPKMRCPACSTAAISALAMGLAHRDQAGCRRGRKGRLSRRLDPRKNDAKCCFRIVQIRLRGHGCLIRLPERCWQEPPSASMRKAAMRPCPR